MAQAATQESLLTQLTDAMLGSRRFARLHPRFAPEGSIPEIINNRQYASVCRAMHLPERKSHLTEDQKIVVDFVLGSGVNLFAICVLSGLGRTRLFHAMTLFVQNGYDDESPPLDEEQLENLQRLAPRNWEARVWEETSIDHFLSAQPKVRVWQLSPSDPTQIVPQHYGVPIIYHDRIGGGAYGDVWKCEVHWQNPITTSSSKYVAIKVLRSRGEAFDREVELSFDNEVAAIQKMNTLNNEHIVEFITAFRRRTDTGMTWNLVYEYADGGNLREQWERRPHTALSSDDSKWTIEQICGLASALKVAHDPSSTRQPGLRKTHFRHTDLKPENILCFGGTLLKIGDWGSAKQHDKITQFRMRSTSGLPGTKRYEAPEESYDPGETGELISRERHRVRTRLYDVWAMGCVMLEFLIWLGYGKPGLDAFDEKIVQNRGKFYTISGGERVVNPIVLAWINEMKQKAPFQETILRDVLGLIENRLLIVELPPETNWLVSRVRGSQTTSHGCRCTAKELFAEMNRIRKEGNQNQRGYPIYAPPTSLQPTETTPTTAEEPLPRIRRVRNHAFALLRRR